MKKIYRIVFSFFSSLKLAVIVILSLATTLVLGSIWESNYGTETAQYLIYKALWFSALLVLLGINVACAALSRYPWKKRHIGFVIVHTGIITLLIGSLMTKHSGINGNLPIQEGSSSNEVLLPEKILVIENQATGELQKHFLSTGPFAKKNIFFETKLENSSLTANIYYPYAFMSEGWVPSDKSEITAVEIFLFNDKFKISKWLDTHENASIDLGPALLGIKELASPQELSQFLKPVIKKNTPKNNNYLGKLLLSRDGEKQRSFSIFQNDTLTVKDLGLTLKVLKYYPHALVENGKLINKSQEPINPAIEVLIVGPQGKEKHTVFSNFPDFPTLHGIPKSPHGITLQLIHEAQSISQKAKLLFAVGPDKKLYYQVHSKQGQFLKSGQAQLNETIALGWMDLKFKTLQFLQSATKTSGFEEAFVKPNAETKPPAALQLVSGDHKFWLSLGDTKTIKVNKKNYTISFMPNIFKLPFEIYLKKFEVGYDPGTQSPASYKSYVSIIPSPATTNTPAVVMDSLPAGIVAASSHRRATARGALSEQATIPAGKLSIDSEIYMNNPLHFHGLTFYQASYELRGDAPPISVLSVNSDPGRWVKYAGSIFIVFGIAFMFYFNRLFLVRKRQ